MRPLRLVMQAFGPYRDEQVLDFTELGPNRVFLIHGDTGSGKTTILDAIVFALYGSTSGGERQAEQMRSESALPTVPTEVTFDFALGGRSYRIRRRPTQLLAGVRAGSALVTKQAEVSMWDTTGCGPDDEGRPLTSKIREADARVKALLGFSCDQFRQVVVLPQGRFRELLSAGSDKREEILRQLFRSDRFKEVEAQLVERARDVRRQMEQVAVQRQTQLEMAGARDEAGLRALLEAAEAAVTRGAAEVTVRGDAQQAATRALQAAEAAHEADKARSQARAAVEALETKKSLMEQQRLRLEAAARAERVEQSDASRRDVAARLEETRAAHAGALTALDEARMNEEAAVAQLTLETQKQPQRLVAEERVRELERLVGVRDAWLSAERDRRAAAKEAHEAEGEVERAQVAQAEAQAEVEEGRQRAEAAHRAQSELQSARVRIKAAERRARDCARLVSVIAAVDQARAEEERLGQAEQQAAEVLRAQESRLTQVEEGWKAGRAAALARSLAPGAPCPVCGSREHPAPAVSEGSETSDDDLERARAAATAARAAHDQARSAWVKAASHQSALRAEAAAVQAEIVGMAVPGAATSEVTSLSARSDVEPLDGGVARTLLHEADAALDACTADVQALEAQADVDAARQQMERAERTSAEHAQTVEAAKTRLAMAREALARAETRVAERAGGVPEGLVEQGALEAALVAARAGAAALAESMEDAMQAASAAKETRVSLQARAAELGVSLSRLTREGQAAQERFEAALTQNGFADEAEWRAQRLDEAERLRSQEELARYQEESQVARGRLAEAQARCEQCADAGDVEQLRSALEAAQSAFDRAVSAHAEAQSHLRRLEAAQAGLAALAARSQDIDDAYQTVGVLADTASGQNESRVSFQRWVLGVYLDEVLAVAGRKLYNMSKGRYRFERQRDPQSRRRPAGLDIAVFDEFSGTARPAVTLSGGESFLAALALALGLAETVQAHAAGTPLETIFVDEGFGALDPDALELALDTLMELQSSGRLVGVISHVAELRDVIPARLEVRGGSSGSSARFVVP